MIRLLEDNGSGRCFIVIREADCYQSLAGRLVSALPAVTRTLLLETERVNNQNWYQLTEGLEQVLKEKKIRQASFVALGNTCSLVQNLSLTHPRKVRTLVLIDGATRPAPGIYTRLINWCEQSLPLGLPFRSHMRGFDGRPFLQRIRVPVLIVTTERANDFERSEAEIMARHLPTCWYVNLDFSGDCKQEVSTILDFEKVPARCPQKNRKLVHATSTAS
ncbi:MAG: alpha/beta hydrolase [Candidatus Dadabacteria bacterium]|nr:MAG: alpha/beta hydrolase [Candidatus Dadabacteria bacterium]